VIGGHYDNSPAILVARDMLPLGNNTVIIPAPSDKAATPVSLLRTIGKTCRLACFGAAQPPSEAGCPAFARDRARLGPEDWSV